ncbi:MAG TPA: glutamine--fructose-6-phosphate aminotransferase, partial [Syntrophomonas sp.]|nr:glutamine--fructose-6-phosphate aminotransferase [Syntrophomonas sp.]
MCGIMGYIGRSDAVPVIIDGLSRLEYRGYDSAGIVVYRPGMTASLDTMKRKGRLAELIDNLQDFPGSTLGIGHTRWAT